MANIKISDIKRALVNGTIAIIQNPNDGYLSARCGIYWFYFANYDLESFTPEEFKAKVKLLWAAHMIEKAIKGLDETEQNYYSCILQEMPNWSEIKCDYMNDFDKFWRVDAYKSDWDYWNDSDIEGEVIAYIDSDSGHVLYNDPSAKTDPYAQEVIQKKVLECKQNSHDVRNVLFSFIETNKPFPNEPANDPILWDQLRSLFVSVVIGENLEPDTREVDDLLADVAERAELYTSEGDYEGYVNFMLAYLV